MMKLRLARLRLRSTGGARESMRIELGRDAAAPSTSPGRGRGEPAARLRSQYGAMKVDTFAPTLVTEAELLSHVMIR
jgi:hypothetical protein